MSAKHEDSTSAFKASDEPANPLRWVVVAMLFFATLINYLDRQSLSVLIPVLSERFRISNVGYSQIVFVFMFAYTASNLVAGYIVDRLGSKIGYALFMLWWSIASILQALAGGVYSFGFYRFLLGIGEAGNWPAAVKVVAEWFPARERALASGIFNSGASIGAIIAPPALVWLYLRFGWQSAFIVVGMSGLLWLLVWWLIYRPAATSDLRLQPTIPPQRLLRMRWVWYFTFSKLLMDPVWYFYVFWIPQYMKEVYRFDIGTIGKVAWIPFCTASLGNFLGGATSAYLVKRMPTIQARRLGYGLFACLLTAAIPTAFVSNPKIAIALISLATLGYTGALANQLAIPADLFGGGMAASIWGLASAGAGFGGMIFSLLTGWLIDRYSYKPAFILFGILPVLSASVTSYLLRRVPNDEFAVGNLRANIHNELTR
ncbi:MAG: MFS transporter [Bryobacteraceae bacterium]